MVPAIGTGTGTAYFVNSVPFLANGNNNPVGNTLACGPSPTAPQ
jgi:hypothetical protein